MQMVLVVSGVSGGGFWGGESQDKGSGGGSSGLVYKIIPNGAGTYYLVACLDDCGCFYNSNKAPPGPHFAYSPLD